MNSSLIATAWIDFFNLLRKQWKSFAWFIVLTFVLMVAHFLFAFFVAKPIGISNPMPGLLVQFIEFVAYIILVSGLGFGIVRSINDENGEHSLGALLSRGSFRFFRTFGSSLGAGLLILLAVGIDALVIYLVYAIVGSLLVAGILAFISFVIFLYFVNALAFLRFRIILENEGPITAIKSAMEMVAGRWWKTLGSVFFMTWSFFGAIFFVLLFAMIVFVLPFVFINTFLAAGSGVGPGLPSLQNFGSSILSAGSVGTGSLVDLTRTVMNFVLGFLGVLALAFAIFVGSMSATFGWVALYRAFKKIQ